MSDTTLQSIAYHRNGVFGAGFYAIVFNWDDGERVRRMMATVFDAEAHIAVLDIGLLSIGNVTFGENSWRGDAFEDDCRKWIADYSNRASEAA